MNKNLLLLWLKTSSKKRQEKWQTTIPLSHLQQTFHRR